MFKHGVALGLAAAATILSLAWSGEARAVPAASATLTSFIQDGNILNNAGSAANISKIVYSLGTAEDNLATWEAATSGGVASDFLSNPNWFQTITWDGLSITPGNAFNFAGLDIDLIVTLTPLNVTGSIIGTPTTLRNASVSVYWDNGASGSAELALLNWDDTQELQILSGRSNAIPEPGTLALFGAGMIGLGRLRRRKKAA